MYGRITRKKIVAVLVVALTLAIPSAARADWIGNVRFDRPTPSDLPWGTLVTVSFEIQTSEAAGVRVLVVPFTQGAPTPGRSSATSPVHSVGWHSLTRTFTVNGPNPRVVDHVRIQILTADYSEVRQEFFLRVRYDFAATGIFGIGFEKPVGSILARGTPLRLSCSYARPGTGNVTLNVTFMRNGQELVGSGTIPAGGPPTGTVTVGGIFDQDTDVDQVRIRMLDATTWQLLHQIDRPVDFAWRQVAITFPVFNVTSPGLLFVDEPLIASYGAQNPTSTGARITLQPYFQGQPSTPTTFTSVVVPAGEPAYPGQNEIRAGGPTSVDEIRIMVRSSTTNEIWFIRSIPVDYRFALHTITNVSLTPKAPALMSPYETCRLRFSYRSVYPEPVLLDAQAYFQGGLVADQLVWPADPRVTPTGTVITDFHVDPAAPSPEVDRLRITMKTQSGTLLQSWDVSTRLLWGDSGWVTPAPPARARSRVHLAQNLPNPFNPSTVVPVHVDETTHVRVTLFDLRGRLLAVLADETMGPGRHDIAFDGGDLASGTYFYRLEGGPEPQTRRMVLLK